jgi:DNA-binding response OmpR family regulator
MQQESDNGQLIYLIDSDSSITRLIALNLTAKGYEVKVFPRGHDALAILDNDQPNLVLMGLLLPDCGGLEIAKLIRQCAPPSPS